MLGDLLTAGGTIETREFHTPQELMALPQRIIIDCTGYAARQLRSDESKLRSDESKLRSDESIVPVRGQIAWLIPQEGVTYGLNYNGLNVLARRDGIVLMLNNPGEDAGWNDSTEVPDRATAEEAATVLQEHYDGMAKIQPDAHNLRTACGSRPRSIAEQYGRGDGPRRERTGTFASERI